VKAGLSDLFELDRATFSEDTMSRRLEKSRR
jgi:hypothetical protein